MPNIDFGKTTDEAVFALKGLVARMHSDVYGNGRKGLLDEFSEFVTDFKARKEETEKQHKENRARLNVIIGILGLIVTYLVFIETVRHDQKSALHTEMSVVAQLKAQE